MTPLKPLNSTMLEAAGYDLASRTLAVRFRNGTVVHRYHDVPPEIAEGLESAESAGRYFNANVRGKFPIEVINKESAAAE